MNTSLGTQQNISMMSDLNQLMQSFEERKGSFDTSTDLNAEYIERMEYPLFKEQFKHAAVSYLSRSVLPITKSTVMTFSQFASILINLSIVIIQPQSSNEEQILNALKIPKLCLLWQILQTVQLGDQKEKVSLEDVMVIMAAILDFQAPELVEFNLSLLLPTKNPLLFRRKETLGLVFQSFSDMEKFSIKFSGFKQNYKKHQQFKFKALEEPIVSTGSSPGKISS